MKHRLTSYELARLQVRQDRRLLAIVLFGLLMALFMSAALIPAGIHRQAAWHYAEARV
ncbi:hypothetical protein [Pararhizobium sp. DWP3-4]|uniref:hypothetical protein n=1 Tax=Pararhizobium sp. DWP3-4 TaxID=2804565 RepID=UPI003CEFE452